jgi:hypothetical protein
MAQKIYNGTSDLQLENKDWYHVSSHLIQNLMKNTDIASITPNFESILDLKK